MSELYENLLKATDNTSDITNEKYGTITKTNGMYYNVIEEDTNLEHTNVPTLNGIKVESGDKVIIGFIDNSIYLPVILGTVGEKSIYSKKEIDKIVEDIEKGETPIEDYSPNFTYSFGLSGVNDTITIHTFLEKINNEG